MYNDSINGQTFHNRRYDGDCNRPCAEHRRIDFERREEHAAFGKREKDIYINNNPVIKINVNGAGGGGEEREPFLSSYMEALGTGQTVAANSDVVFDADSIDSVGDNIGLDAAGTTFTINRTGLYQVEWNLNLAAATTSAVFGIIENGMPASGSGTVTGGNFASGTLINVDTVPFTLSLHNFSNAVTIADIDPFTDSAASIRITRFAEGPGQ